VIRAAGRARGHVRHRTARGDAASGLRGPLMGAATSGQIRDGRSAQLACRAVAQICNNDGGEGRRAVVVVVVAWQLGGNDDGGEAAELRGVADE
jgi:hypothetical protein